MQAQGREDLTRYLDANPLYASLEVKLVDPSRVRIVGDALRADPSVRNVINIEDLVERVLTVTNLLRTAGTVLLVIVGVIALFIIINTIRLAVLARAEEIEIMRLVGASDAFIRWPFVFEGAFVGLLASLATLAILAAVANPLSAFMADFFRVLPLQFGSLTRDLVALVHGRRDRARDPRLVAVGADLPHPLSPRPPRNRRSGRRPRRHRIDGTTVARAQDHRLRDPPSKPVVPLRPSPRDAARRTD